MQKNLQLAIDTSSSKPVVALLSDTQLLAEWFGNSGNQHDAELLRGIDKCLTEAQIKLEDLDFLSVGVGPGTFTGIRVGISCAKILADVHQLPVVAVSSLLAMALAALDMEHADSSRNVFTIANARKNEVYLLKTKLHEILVDKKMDPSEQIAHKVEDISAQLKKGDLLLGEAAQIYAESWPEEIERIPANTAAISGKNIASIGLHYFLAKETIAAHELQARYLLIQ